jgi:uncharacterized Zn finger protein (UPF0148 family)
MGSYKIKMMCSGCGHTNFLEIRTKTEKKVKERVEEGEFHLKEELKKLEESKNDALSVIGWFLQVKKTELKSKEQLQQAIKRHIKIANQVAKFDDKQILQAYNNVKEFPEFTLETIWKKLTR